MSWAAYTGDTNQQWKFTNTKTGPTAPPSTPPPTQSDKDTALDAFFIPADTSNYTANRIAQGGSIQKITIHHCAGVMSVHTLGNLWQNPARNGSSHYGVSGVNIGQYVRERDVAWTDGNWTSNIRSVTIETSNSATGGNWPVSVSTFNTLVLLVADIAWRNGLGQLVKGVNLTWHSMYASTACPGPYLLSQMDNLVNRANALNGYSTPADPTGPVISDAAYAAGVRLGTKNGVNYYDYTAPFNNLFAMAKAQAEEHRCTSFEQYCEEWVAEYPTVQPSLAAHAGLVLGSFTWFYQQVNHDAVWDIKREERWNEALPHIPFLGVTAKQFLYNGELRSAEEMGNVMYGFVGRACGFSSITLYWGGGVAAQGGMNNPEVNTPDLYGDTQEDHDAITDGFNLFEAQYPSYPDVGFEGIPIEQGILAALADLII